MRRKKVLKNTLGNKAVWGYFLGQPSERAPNRNIGQSSPHANITYHIHYKCQDLDLKYDNPL